jgi:hypothetical protein
VGELKSCWGVAQVQRGEIGRGPSGKPLLLLSYFPSLASHSSLYASECPQTKIVSSGQAAQGRDPGLLSRAQAPPTSASSLFLPQDGILQLAHDFMGSEECRLSEKRGCQSKRITARARMVALVPDDCGERRPRCANGGSQTGARRPRMPAKLS